MNCSKHFLAATATILLTAAAFAASSPAALYHDQEALTTALHVLARNNADATLQSLGRTAGGRELHLLEIA
ncbi:hypothetical protein KKA85_01040, partial [bacterium]|nr:hypothetical protein [bacterium]